MKSLQSLVKTESGKKNIKRTIERNTNDFTFTKCGRNFLVYPRSWKTEDMVSELYKSQMKLLEIEKANEPETIACQSGSIIRNEVKNMDYTMPWPPSPEDLNAIDFQIPKHLDSFLIVLLSGNLNVPSDRVDRLKLSFAQDVIYAGMFSKLSLSFVLLSLTLLRQFKQKSTWGLVFYTRRKRSLLCISLRFRQPIKQHIPSWTGFFIKIRQDIPIRPSSVGCLDCLDAPATEMSTVYHILERTLRIKSQLNVQSIVCVYDQAIYAKAYQIKCKEPERFKSIFLMMGTFHIIMTLLVVMAVSSKMQVSKIW